MYSNGFRVAIGDSYLMGNLFRYFGPLHIMQDGSRNDDVPITVHGFQQAETKVNDFSGVQLIAHHLKVRASQVQEFLLFFVQLEAHISEAKPALYP
jgi:hypothetical protein